MNAKSARPDFWKERDPWPYAHAIVPLTLYAMSREYLFSLLLIYVWESAEALIGLFAPYYDENKYNSLISDPLVGALAITTLFLLDCATGWGDAFCETTSVVSRVIVFVLVGVGSTVLLIDRNAERDGETINRGVVVLAIGAVFVGAIVFGVQLSSQTGDATVLATQSLMVWVVIVLLLGLVTVPRFSQSSALSSTFWRILIVELALFLLAVVVLVIAAICNKHATSAMLLELTRSASVEQESLEYIDSPIAV
jgi:hypothetical protein